MVEKAIQEPQAHYYSMSKGTRRKNVSRNNLIEIFYKNETTFIFENYITKLKGVFNVLGRYGIIIYEEQMVEHKMDQSRSPNKYLKREVNICRSSHSSTFFKAYTYLSAVVERP